jgi:8-oxo-dGTP pyrophosphatase MutT (NUDIX family)
MATLNISEAEIARRLAHALEGYQGDPVVEIGVPAQKIEKELVPAAVLIPLLLKDSSWHVLLTRRNANLPEHSGQVAFPGGRADPEDANLEQTALREAEEEIGLVPEDVRILGKLKNYLTITNYLVTPIVGVIPWPYPLRIARKEVTRVFTVPLEWLVDPRNYEVQMRELPKPLNPIPVVFFKPYEKEILWGASARIVLAFARALRLIQPD